MSHTAQSRKERAREIRARVNRAIDPYQIPELDGWRPAWDLVIPRADAFFDAVDQWELTGSPEDQRAVKETAADLIWAWQTAAGQWKQHAASQPTGKVAYAA